MLTLKHRSVTVCDFSSKCWSASNNQWLCQWQRPCSQAKEEHPGIMLFRGSPWIIGLKTTTRNTAPVRFPPAVSSVCTGAKVFAGKVSGTFGGVNGVPLRNTVGLSSNVL